MLTRTTIKEIIVTVAVWGCGLGFHMLQPLAQSQAVSCEQTKVESRIDFAKDIQPILQANCYKCHGPNAQLSGLRLDSQQAAIAGGGLGNGMHPCKSLSNP